VRRARHSGLCVPLPARRDRSELSTSQCLSHITTPHPTATASGGMCALRATCVCRTRRVAIESNRAPLCANRASRTPARLPLQAEGRAPGVPLVCAASGASRLRRAEHVPVPLARRDCSPPSKTCGGICAGRATCVCRFRRVATAASRARPRANHAARQIPAYHGLRRDVR
jgi:hypothetical protein